MKRTSIRLKNQNLLWAISGGRCEYEGCNKELYRDLLTKKEFNIAYIAHNVGNDPNGPRGEKKRSTILADNIDNLMLLCDEHHRLIDKFDVTGHPEEKLQAMKRKHEERIRRLTSIAPEMSTEIILYGANIGDNNSPLSYKMACDAIAPDFYPASEYAIELGQKNSSLSDNTETYWAAEAFNLCKQFDLKIKPRLMHGNTDHYSLFALAPQPLLIRLGVLINDLSNLRLFQKHREPSTWKWQISSSNVEYIFREPTDKTKIPVLVISLSTTVTHNRIERILGDSVSLWEITLSDKPNNDFLKTEALLSDFRRTARYAFDKIKSHHGCIDLHVFPAMPVSAAVELGRVWMPKADMPLVIYDENRTKDGFFKTITIK